MAGILFLGCGDSSPAPEPSGPVDGSAGAASQGGRAGASGSSAGPRGGGAGSLAHSGGAAGTGGAGGAAAGGAAAGASVGGSAGGASIPGGSSGASSAGAAGAPTVAAEIVLPAPEVDFKQGVFGMCLRGADLFFHNGVDSVWRVPASGGIRSAVSTTEAGAPAGLVCAESGVYWATGAPDRSIRSFDVGSGKTATLWQATAADDPNGILFVEGQDELYFSTRTSARIGRLPRVGGTPTFLVAATPPLLPPVSDGGALFWTSFVPPGQGSPPTKGTVHSWMLGGTVDATQTLAADRVGPLRLAVVGNDLLWIEPLREGDKIFRLAKAGGEPVAVSGTADVTAFVADAAGMAKATPQGVLVGGLDGSTKVVVANPSPNGLSLLLTPSHVYLGAIDRAAIWRAPR